MEKIKIYSSDLDLYDLYERVNEIINTLNDIKNKVDSLTHNTDDIKQQTKPTFGRQDC